MIYSENQIQNYFKSVETELFKKDRIRINFKRNWAIKFDNEQGVYALFDNGNICYVGETGNLKKRMMDLRRTLNHSFRRVLGEKLYSNRMDYFKATSNKKFSSEIEKFLNAYMEENIEVVMIPLKLGRLEFEEYMIALKKYELLNIKEKRK